MATSPKKQFPFKSFAGGTTKQKINKQDTKHGKMDMPFANLNSKAGKRKGGSIRRYAEGGDVEVRQYSPEAEKWLGGADRTDRFIVDRMKAANPGWDTQAPAPVEERSTDLAERANTAPVPPRKSRLPPPQSAEAYIKGVLAESHGPLPARAAPAPAAPTPEAPPARARPRAVPVDAGGKTADDRAFEAKQRGDSNEDQNDRMMKRAGSNEDQNDRMMKRAKPTPQKAELGQEEESAGSDEAPSDQKQETKKGSNTARNAAITAGAVTALGGAALAARKGNLAPAAAVFRQNPARAAAREAAAEKAKDAAKEEMKKTAEALRQPPRTGGAKNPKEVAVAKGTVADKTDKIRPIAAKTPGARKAVEKEPGWREKSRRQMQENVAENSYRRGGSVKRFASGGSVSSASRRGDGIAQRGKTRA